MSKSLDRLTLLSTFVRIADAGSLSAAARGLGLSQPSVSRQLAELEARLRIQLVRRNTHSLALTEAGRELLGDARAMLDGWEALAERYSGDHDAVAGTLKVIAPIALGQRQLARVAWEFQLAHDQLRLEWILDDEPVRFAEMGCDCWVRAGSVADDTLIVRPLGEVERLLVASQGFVERYGLPGSPKVAQRLHLVAARPFEGGAIGLKGPQGRTELIRPPVRLASNNIVAVKEAVAMGVGMAVLPRWFVDGELARGAFVDLLPHWRAPALTIHVAYLPARYQPRRLRAFLEHLTEQVPRLAGVNGVAVAD